MMGSKQIAAALAFALAAIVLLWSMALRESAGVAAREVEAAPRTIVYDRAAG